MVTDFMMFSLLQALEHFIQCSITKYPEGEHIDLAVQTVILYSVFSGGSLAKVS